MSTFFSTAPSVDVAHLNTMLARLRSVPALADRYQGVPALTRFDDLGAVPVMVKNDLQVALAHLKPRATGGTTWVFQSGGNTGSPMFGYAPTGLYMAEVHEQWGPLSPDDIVVNAWSAGKMWGAHYLFNELVDLSGCTAMCLGAIARSEYDAWFEFFGTQRITAIGGTPSVLRLLFAHARDTGVKLPELRKVLWLGEAWDPHLDDDIPAVATNAGRWGMFGSTETWVVATNTPRCAVDTWHVLPSQVVHVGEDDMLDFTSVKPHGLNPVLRYQTGDAGQLVSCPCGDPRPALRILGRRDGLVKFRGHLVSVDDLVGLVTARPGVTRAQLVVHEYPDRGSMLEVLVLPGRDADPDLADRVRDFIVASAFGPSIVFQRNPDSLLVSTVDALISNERTGKTSNLVVRQEK